MLPCGPCAARAGRDRSCDGARASPRRPRLLGSGALVARHVADRLPADAEDLVAGLALARLPRRGGVRVRVGVQEVVAVGTVGGRAGRAALVVGPLRRGDDDEALRGAVDVADAEQARGVAEE